MTLKAKIYNDMLKANKEGTIQEKNTLKLIFGEIQRLPDKNPSDLEIIKIIKKLKQHHDDAVAKNYHGINGELIDILYKYIPKDVDEKEVKAWIFSNINFDDYKNKMQAMKPIMNEFAGRIDGNKVKKIIEEF